MVNFIKVDALTTYNAIFGWLLLNTFYVVVLTYQVAIKFLIRGEEITIKGNLNYSRAYYLKAIGRSRKEEVL